MWEAGNWDRCVERRECCVRRQRKISMWHQQQRSVLWGHMLKMARVFQPLEDQGSILPWAFPRLGITSYHTRIYSSACGTVAWQISAVLSDSTREHLAQQPLKVQTEDGGSLSNWTWGSVGIPPISVFSGLRMLSQWSRRWKCLGSAEFLDSLLFFAKLTRKPIA